MATGAFVRLGIVTECCSLGTPVFRFLFVPAPRLVFLFTHVFFPHVQTLLLLDNMAPRLTSTARSYFAYIYGGIVQSILDKDLKPTKIKLLEKI